MKEGPRRFVSDDNKEVKNSSGCNWWVFVPSFLFLMLGTIYFGVKEQPAEMGLAIIAGAIGMAFSSLDKFEFFKGAGFEAKTRELRKVVDEGNETLERLRAVTLFSAESVLTQVIAMGRLGVNLRLRNETKAKVDRILKVINAQPDEIDEVEKYWRKYTIADYISHILGGSTVPDGFNQDEINEWKELRKGLIDNPTSPENLRDFLAKYGMLDTEREGLIKDYEYYLENSIHRDEEAWENRVDKRLVKNLS